MDFTELQLLAATIWNYDGVRLITAGVLLNLILAVAVAMRTGVFSLRVLGQFLYRQLAPYVLVYYGFHLFSDGTGFEWVSVVVLGLISAMIAGAIIEKLSELGVPIPEKLLSLFQRRQTIVTLRQVDDDAHG